MNEQGRNRYDFQFQLQLFGIDTKHDSGKPVSKELSKALFSGSRIDVTFREKYETRKLITFRVIVVVIKMFRFK
ncbi:MAG: hypothetical protein GY797_03130 [Deltaproteobacteria bacterium]|nr:hypothetical protein [Deltaproteobacteria bacterium]